MGRPVNPFDRPPADDGPAPSDQEVDDVHLATDPPRVDETVTGPGPFGNLSGVPDGDGRGPSSLAPAGSPPPAAATAGAATMLLEDEDDEPVGLFARTPFTPGAGPRVDLLPSEVVTVRLVRRAQRRGALVLVAVLALVVAAYVLVSGERTMAREDLAAAQQRSVQLTAEQARYARAPIVYAQVEQTRAALASVMAGDVRWYQYLADLAVTSPPGLWLTSWQASTSDPTLAPATPDPAAGAPAAVAPVATLTVSGTAADEPDVADWLDVLAATPGLTGSTASSLTRTAVGEQPVITFDSSASMTEAALSDRYAVKD